LMIFESGCVSQIKEKIIFVFSCDDLPFYS